MTRKRFVIIQVLIILMLSFALVCNTYSWAQRPAVQGGNFMSTTDQDTTDNYNDKRYWTAMSIVTPANGYYINGNSCTGTTYAGTMGADGEITYDTTAVTSVSEQDVTADTALYFKTEIANSAAVVTNTSLFIDISYSTSLEDNYYIGVTTPTKDYLTYAAESTSGTTSTIRWIPVVAQYEIAASGSAFIEWYIDFESSGTFQITNIVLTNN